MIGFTYPTKNISHIPMSISNRRATKPPILSKKTFLCFKSIIPLPRPTKMLPTIPNQPIKEGTTPEVTNTIENASVPIDQNINANANLELFVLVMVRAKSLNDFFSASLILEYFLAILRSSA